jgi:hypothetical protein
MTEPKAAIAALTFVLLAPHGALAQIASRVEAGSVMTQQEGELPASAFSVAPGIRVDLPYFALTAKGSAWLTGQSWQIADGTISGSLLSPVYNRFRGEIVGNASRAFFDQSLENDQVDAQARLHMLFSQNSGIWVGGGVARPWRIAVVSAVDVTGGGAWTKVGDAMLSGTYTSFSSRKLRRRATRQARPNLAVPTMIRWRSRAPADHRFRAPRRRARRTTAAVSRDSAMSRAR